MDYILFKMHVNSNKQQYMSSLSTQISIFQYILWRKIDLDCYRIFKNDTHTDNIIGPW